MPDPAITPQADGPIFDHTHVWVNRGEWRSGSHEGDAINRAVSAAMDAGVWGPVYDATRIVIDRLPCNDDSHLGCRHTRVRFYAAPPDNGRTEGQ